MLLHFIFVIKEEDLDSRKQEFEYVKSMAKFFQKWIKENFEKSGIKEKFNKFKSKKTLF